MALFGLFGLGIWTELFIVFMVIGFAVERMLKAAAKSPTVQQGAANWFISLFK
jgi:hypothetical protein